MEDKGITLIAWDKVCKPKQHGGLGILDIAIHNKDFLMTSLFEFLNKGNIPWLKLIWEKYCSSSSG